MTYIAARATVTVMPKQAKKAKKWFIPLRGSYLPNSWQGWLLYLPYTAYIVGVLMYVELQHDDVWMSFFLVAPNWVAALAVMTWVAKRQS